jgi:hypothetical protein
MHKIAAGEVNANAVLLAILAAVGFVAGLHASDAPSFA